MNNAQTGETRREKRTYVGRRYLLSLMRRKSVSTQRWLIKKLQQHVTDHKEGKRKLLSVAKKLGLRVARLELRE